MVITMVEEIRSVKDKIGSWLREESIFPREALDPQAHFNFSIQLGNLNVNVVQKVDWRDSIVLGTTVFLGPLSDKIDQMNQEKKHEFFWGSEFRIVEKRRNWRF
jgi:hypothetical protein